MGSGSGFPKPDGLLMLLLLPPLPRNTLVLAPRLLAPPPLLLLLPLRLALRLEGGTRLAHTWLALGLGVG